jgi:hypothetical protein
MPITSDVCGTKIEPMNENHIDTHEECKIIPTFPVSDNLHADKGNPYG